MESGSLGMDTSTAPDHRRQSDCSLAFLRRRAWAQSKESTWQSEAESFDQGPQENQRDGEEQKPSEEPGQVPNNITSWLNECRTPIGASLDDQSATPSKGVLKNGCSFEDDLSLGAEANHLQTSNSKTESCFDLVAQQKRSQYKERTRSMNSTGSGNGSTVSSVSELLDLYEEDPEEVLLNLGFGREEPDLNSKVPSRFFNNSSIARGIDIKVYLGAQLQRMEVENPNYALTSRFRQIEVLTTVANEFFQLYSQVSGHPVQRISSRDQEGGGDESVPPLRRTGSARNVAKLLKKTLSKHNLLAAAPESAETKTPNQHTQPNGHATSDHTHTNGHAHAGPEQGGSSTDLDHQAEMVNQKHLRKKDSCYLATVTEETIGDGDDSPEQSRTGPAANEEHPPESTDSLSTNETTEEGTQVVKEEQEEKNMTSTPEKAPPTLAPLQLAQLRMENTDSFDMEEFQINEDEALPPRTSRATDLLRTVSQQSDSSGFAEEPSADSNSYLKVQESSDSCDSETTVTSHPSLDVATPLAMDQPVFTLPDGREEEAGPGVAPEADGRSSSRGEDQQDGSSEQVPQYSAHHLPRNRPMGTQQDETREEEEEEEQVESGDRTDPDPDPDPDPEPEPEPEPEQEIAQSMSAAEQEPQPELEHTQNQSASEQEPQHSQNQTETATDTEQPTEGVGAENEAQEEHAFLDDSGALCPPPAPPSPVLSALIRAKQKRLTRVWQRIDPESDDSPQVTGRGRGRRGIPLQRSSSLPSTFLSPSRVVSSVRIQFGRGQASCTQPRYSFKYTQEGEGDKEEEEKEERQTNCLSTLIINPASSSDSINQQPRLSTEASIPPKHIPRHLLRSNCFQQSYSPPPDWSPGGHVRSWSTQSVPDLSSNQQQPGQFQQNMSANQNQQSWNPGQMMFRYPNPNPTAQYVYPSPNPSPSLNPSPYPFTLNPPPQYPSLHHPYGSLPNLLHQHNLSHHSSQTSLYQPTTPIIPQHSSLSNLHQPSTSAAPHHVNLDNLPPGTPAMHHQGYNPLYGHQSPYHAASYGSQFASPYLGYHGYNMNPHLAFPHPVTQYPPFAQEHSLHPGFAPPTPGFFPGLASTHGPGYSLQPGLAPHAAPSPGPSQGPSVTEMQLRRVLHDIRGTVQSLSQNRANTPDAFSEHRAAPPGHQSFAEFQQKKQSLNLFRSQMMDLEQSIIRQQALVYKHLSPADRMEVEQLQSLRSAVREELQELEQQLEDRLMDLTHHTQHRGLHRDSLYTASALRAMEPVSDLLREQLFLQSELSYGGNAPSTNPSTRSSSPVRGGGRGGDGEQEGSVYRASIIITPVPPPRPNTRTEEEEEEGEREGETDGGGGGGVVVVPPEEEGAAGGVRAGNLQQLIREIRESVAQEVRQEIYSELLASVTPRQAPLPGRQNPL
ncbi:protein ITPRID2 isoform X2 [Sebastes umbrosus]|uniref:protein ITPRID2 isoform X2 n=1 Tax=Sebastes umbrosus TaxID=72105 RepID=UPI0018A0AFA7|nr:protein ITPRID2 isoform X2 [Sebastes umbrosus]